MQQSYFGKEHFAQWAPGMKTLDDALSIRQRLFTAFEIAETLPPGPERDSWLTFAVAGGGPTGVELAGQIREMAHEPWPTSSTASNPRKPGCCCSTAGTGS